MAKRKSTKVGNAAKPSIKSSSLRSPKGPNVAISSSQSAMRVPRKKLTELIQFVASSEGVRLAEVDLAIVDSKEMAGLNEHYLRHMGETDVLSFDLSDDDSAGVCAQLIVCGPVALEQAKARNLPPQRELMLYVVHGLLHMMGYEDHTIRGAARMHARQEELLDAYLGK